MNGIIINAACAIVALANLISIVILICELVGTERKGRRHVAADLEN